MTWMTMRGREAGPDLVRSRSATSLLTPPSVRQKANLGVIEWLIVCVHAKAVVRKNLCLFVCIAGRDGGTSSRIGGFGGTCVCRPVYRKLPRRARQSICYGGCVESL